MIMSCPLFKRSKLLCGDDRNSAGVVVYSAQVSRGVNFLLTI
jgi:hypothetical protein